MNIKIKRWGNSLGIVLPKKIVEEQGLEEGEEVIIQVFRPLDLTEVFGTLKADINSQEMKDEARKNWDKVK